MLRAAPLAASILLVACAAAPPMPDPAPPSAPPAATAAPSSAPAALPTPEQAVMRLFSAQRADEAWFGPAFLKSVPIAKIDAITGGIRASSGALVSVRPQDGKKVLLTFERAAFEGVVELDDQGRFTTLFVRPAEPATATLEEAVAAFRTLPGKVNLWIATDGVERAAVEPDLALAAGSTFKLAILAALRTQVEAKKRAWKDVIELDPKHRSLPSGILQKWPDRAPMTLYSLAALMISASDNTATDELLSLAGRGAVEALAPRNKPFLATGEMFKLKGPGGEGALAAYRKGTESERRKVIEELAGKPLPSVEAYPTAPTALDVEWFFTPRELCALMKKVHDLPLMAINPGVAKKGDWDTVAYKGGSEPGVFSMTTWVTKQGKSHCVSATWNADQKLDEPAFHAAYVKALVALKK